MLKRFSHFLVCLLLLLLPLQGVAAANMSICNSIMQSSVQLAMQNMPCHNNMKNNAQHLDKHNEKSTCKAHCATLCASLSAMTALPSNPPATNFFGCSPNSELYATSLRFNHPTQPATPTDTPFLIHSSCTTLLV